MSLPGPCIGGKCTVSRVDAILQAAAANPELLDMLLRDREGAIARMGLSPEEKDAILAMSPAELRRVAGRGDAGLGKALRSRLLLIAGVVVLLVILGRLKAGGEAGHIKETLYRLSLAEDVYRQRYGAWADLETLLASPAVPDEALRREVAEGAYRYVLELQGDRFVITARHRTEPGAHPALRIGPDGKVEDVPRT